MKTLAEKLDLALGLSPSQKAEKYRQPMRPPRDEEEQRIINQVKFHILRGNSMLKKPLKSGDVDIEDVITAIKDNRCIGASDRDIGSTNLETIIGTAITDIFGDGTRLNRIRKLFGLKPKE